MAGNHTPPAEDGRVPWRYRWPIIDLKTAWNQVLCSRPYVWAERLLRHGFDGSREASDG